MIILLKDCLVSIVVLFCISECFCEYYNHNKVNIIKPNVVKKIKNNKIVRILVLDGGGNRGYIQAKFLDMFCRETGIDNLGKYFDLIVGTSIGGISAVLLANGMKPTDLLKFFREKSQWIFTIRSVQDIFSNNASIPSNKPNKVQMLYMISTGKPFYKSLSDESNYGDARLRKELNSIFNDKLLIDLKTKVLLPAYNLSDCVPVIFSNFKLKSKICVQIINNRKIKIVDALMATSSFPIYFPSITINDMNIADGGLFQCNPSTLALVVAKHMYPSENKYCILSIGTGKVKLKSIEWENNKSFVYNLLPIKYTKMWNVFIQNSKINNDILLKTLSNGKDSNIHYYRFDINLDSTKNCSLDTSTKEFFDYLDNEVEKQYMKEKYNIKKFINKLNEIDSSLICH